ncbi:WG repeat-containing protein [Rhizosphaericola mali]|uniref:WG repeat-containing protein n=1 Tax=Rhizosphaericola mali TaxID=2545455 RepID=A0A5P2G933_9BACT|nr:WG repeat-containing protein [Rhizosphaericola mali]QES90220.1 hypothetical protein E0W69_016710 [Rhizosphaericola mali]
MKYLFLSFCFLFALNHVLAQQFYIPYEHNGKYGLTDEKFQSIITPAIYDKIEPIADSLFVVTVNKKSGIINNYGKLIIPIQYSSFSTSNYIGTPKLYRNFLIIAYLNKKEIYYDFYGNHKPEIKKVPFSLYGKPSTSYCGGPNINFPPFLFMGYNKKYGLLKHSKIQSTVAKFDTIIAPLYDTIYVLESRYSHFHKIEDEPVLSSIYVIKKNDSMGLVEISGKTLLKSGNYDSIYKIDNHIIEFRCKLRKLWGTLFMNNQDFFEIKPLFREIISRYGYYENYHLNSVKPWKLYYKLLTNIFLVKDESGNTYYENLQTGFKYQN